MKTQLTIKETRELKTLFLESDGLLTEGIIDKIKDSIKKRFTGRDTGELKQSLSDNLGIDENSSVEEIEEKLKQETGGKKDLKILTKILREILGFSSAFLIWEIQALIGAGIIKYFDYNPIAIAAVVISVIFSVTENWEKIRRKGLGKKIDQFIYGKRSHLGDFDDKKNKKENDNEMNESRKKIIRLTESDLTRIVRRVIKENKDERRSIGQIIDDIVSKFEFSEKGNDEMIQLANYILENPENVAQKIYSSLKRGYGAHDEDDDGFGVYTSDRESLRGLDDRFNRK
jgi:hypothetical protein